MTAWIVGVALGVALVIEVFAAFAHRLGGAVGRRARALRDARRGL